MGGLTGRYLCILRKHERSINSIYNSVKSYVAEYVRRVAEGLEFVAILIRVCFGSRVVVSADSTVKIVYIFTISVFIMQLLTELIFSVSAYEKIADGLSDITQLGLSIVMESRAMHKAKLYAPILATEAGKLTDLRDRQSRKALSSIFLTDLGISIDSRSLHI